MRRRLLPICATLCRPVRSRLQCFHTRNSSTTLRNSFRVSLGRWTRSRVGAKGSRAKGLLWRAGQAPGPRRAGRLTVPCVQGYGGADLDGTGTGPDLAWEDIRREVTSFVFPKACGPGGRAPHGLLFWAFMRSGGCGGIRRGRSTGVPGPPSWTCEGMRRRGCG